MDQLPDPTVPEPPSFGQVIRDRQRFVQRLVLSLALDPPKAFERARRSRPLAMRRQRPDR